MLELPHIERYHELVKIKGRVPVLSYSFQMVHIYNETISSNIYAVAKCIFQYLREGNLLISRLGVGKYIDYSLSPKNNDEAVEMINIILNPVLDGNLTKITKPVQSIFDMPFLLPYPLKLASSDKLSHTLAWIDSNIKILIEDLLLPVNIELSHIQFIVKTCFLIFANLIKANNYYLVLNMNYNHSIFFQDRIIELLFGINLFNSRKKIETGKLSNKIALNYLQELGNLDLNQLKVLSIFMGIIWTSSSDIQLNFTRRKVNSLMDIENKINEYKRNIAIDDFSIFLNKVANFEINKLVVILDDNGETVYDLAIIQKLLKINERLRITFILNRVPISVNISVEIFMELVSEKYFTELNNAIKSGIIELQIINQYFRSFDSSYFSPSTKRIICNADACYVKGLNFFETMQFKNIDMFYTFTVYGENAINLTGLEELSGIFVGIPKGYVGFEVNDDSSIITLSKQKERIIQGHDSE